MTDEDAIALFRRHHPNGVGTLMIACRRESIFVRAGECGITVERTPKVEQDKLRLTAADYWALRMDAIASGTLEPGEERMVGTIVPEDAIVTDEAWAALADVELPGKFHHVKGRTRVSGEWP